MNALDFVTNKPCHCAVDQGAVDEVAKYYTATATLPSHVFAMLDAAKAPYEIEGV
jgi:hypothetical protein